MADPFVAEIRIFPFNFPPRGWAWCDGQMMPMSQNTVLFSKLGTTHGSISKNSFALPDLRGRAPMHPGQGPGLSLHDLGEQGGSETVSLLATEIPAHTHSLRVTTDDGDLKAPTSSRVLARSTSGFLYQTSAGNLQPLSNQALAATGGNAPHNNMQPYLTLYFCIALQGG